MGFIYCLNIVFVIYSRIPLQLISHNSDSTYKVALMASKRASRSSASCSNDPKINKNEDNETHVDEPHAEEETIHENDEGSEQAGCDKTTSSLT